MLQWFLRFSEFAKFIEFIENSALFRKNSIAPFMFLRIDTLLVAWAKLILFQIQIDLSKYVLPSILFYFILLWSVLGKCFQIPTAQFPFHLPTHFPEEHFGWSIGHCQSRSQAGNRYNTPPRSKKSRIIQGLSILVLVTRGFTVYHILAGFLDLNSSRAAIFRNCIKSIWYLHIISQKVPE